MSLHNIRRSLASRRAVAVAACGAACAAIWPFPVSSLCSRSRALDAPRLRNPYNFCCLLFITICIIYIFYRRFPDIFTHFSLSVRKGSGSRSVAWLFARRWGVNKKDYYLSDISLTPLCATLHLNRNYKLTHARTQ